MSFIFHGQPGRQYPGNLIMPDRSLTWSRTGPRPMPSKPTWFHRLPEILEVFRSMDATHLDRQAVETLFGVGERRARQLMAGLAGIRAGNAAAISRCALIEQMREFATSQPCQREVRPADPPSVRRPARSHPVHGPASCASRSRTPPAWRRSWWNCRRPWPMTGTALCVRSRSVGDR